MRDERVLVYSTDGDLPLPKASALRKTQPVARAMPDDALPLSLSKGQGDTVRVARERRRNSALTVVHGLQAAEVDAVGKELKRLCASGGTAKNGVVEIQGDHRERIVAYFEQRGRRVKRAGG